MKKEDQFRAFWVVFLLTLLLVFFLVIPSSGLSKARIRVVASLYEPFVFYDRGELRGFDIDLLEIISRSRGLHYSIEIVSFKEALHRVAEGTADMAIGAIYMTEERQRLFNFTEPYHKTGLVAVFRTGEVFHLDGLSGKKIGVKEGATGQEIATEWSKRFKGLQVIAFKTTEESFDALVNKKVDLVLNDYINTVYLITKKYPGRLVIAKGVLGPRFLQKTYLAWAVNRNRIDLLRILNEEIKKLKTVGTLEDLSLRWLYTSAPHSYGWIVYYGLVGLLVLVVLIVVIYRYQKNRAIRRTLSDIKLLLEAIPASIYIFQAGRIVYANPAGVKLAGFESFESLMGEDIRVLPFLKTDIPEEILNTLQSDGVLKRSLECTFADSRGRKNHLRLYMKQILYNQAPAVLMVAVDLTHVRESEELLKRMYQVQYAYNRILKVAVEAKTLKGLAENVLEEILDIEFISLQSRGAFFVYDPETQRLIMYAEKNLPSALLDTCQQLPLGKCLCGKAGQSKRVVFKSTLDEDHDIQYEAIQPHGHYCVPVIEKEELLGVITLYLKDGHRYSEMEVEFLKGVSEIVAEAIKRLRLQEEMYEQQRMFFTAIEASPSPIIIHDETRQILYVNQKLLEITGLSREALKEVTDFINSAIVEDDREEALQELEAIYQLEGPSPKRQRRILTTDGKERLWDMISVPIGQWKGRKIVMCVAEDLTEEKNLMQQLLQAQKLEAIGRLTGSIAHDFNNILTAILGYSELLLREKELKETVRKRIDTIYQAAERAAKLVAQLLAFSRKQVMRPQVVDLNELLSGMVKMLERVIGEDIQMEVIRGENLWKVKVDPVLMEQVIMNLVVNARDAMPEGGRLTIETQNVVLTDSYVELHAGVNPGEYVMLSVTDTGCGMTEEIKAHIFEPFFTTKEPGKGTGLGLSTVYGIIKQSDGHIFVYSEPGKGTTFKIYLPRCTEELREEAQERSRLDELPKGNETVLVVEDDEDVRQFAVQLLNELGYTVIECSKPSEALGICERYHGKVHLLLTDVIMPEMNGRQLAEHLRNLCPELKVLFMSGYSDNVVFNHGILPRKVKLLQKPFTVEALARAVREAIDS